MAVKIDASVAGFRVPVKVSHFFFSAPVISPSFYLFSTFLFSDHIQWLQMRIELTLDPNGLLEWIVSFCLMQKPTLEMEINAAHMPIDAMVSHMLQ